MEAEQRRTKRILKEAAEDPILTANEWMQERRTLQSKLAKATEKREEAERSLRAQDTKILALQKQLSSITDAVKHSRTRRLPTSVAEEPDSMKGIGERREMGEVEDELWVSAEVYAFLEHELRV